MLNTGGQPYYQVRDKHETDDGPTAVLTNDDGVNFMYMNLT